MYLVRKTKRLLIRPLLAADYPAWKEAHSIRQKPQNRWDLGSLPSKDITRAKFHNILRWHEKMRKQDKFYGLAIFKSTGEQVGLVSVMDIQRGLGQSAYLGYRIDNPYWRQGFGKEAVTATIDIAFRDLLLHRVEAGVEPGNRRSIALALSVGLRKEGLKKRAVFLRKNWQDLITYAATCEDFGIKWKGKAIR